MKQWRRALCVLLMGMLLVSTALAEEPIDYWYRVTDEIVQIGTRNIHSENLERALWYVWDACKEAGFSVREGTLREQWVRDSSNVEAVMKALSPDPQIIVVGAHIDSLAPGARDNASGVGAVLTLMKLLAERGPYENTEIRFVFFTLEEKVGLIDSPSGERGHFGSEAYVNALSEDEKARMTAMFNIDIFVVDNEASPTTAFSCDTMGMRTENGYQVGSEDAPAYNLPVRTLLEAMQGRPEYAPEKEGITWCAPRHLGQSDHEIFHNAEIDSVNVCFRGNVEEGGSWPGEMHLEKWDVMGDFDLERTAQALDVLYTAIDALARETVQLGET